MILPIVGYGHSILRKKTQDIDKDYPNIKQLINDMFETMYSDYGVGLAAPQVNLSISLIVMDANPFKEKYPEGEGFRMAMINPQLIEESGKMWAFEEGCLSVPGIHEYVSRKETVRVKYMDEDFNEKEITLNGVCARVFQHEYDHLLGKMFVDKLSSIRRAFLKKKLNDIIDGTLRVDYKMIKSVKPKHK